MVVSFEDVSLMPDEVQVGRGGATGRLGSATLWKGGYNTGGAVVGTSKTMRAGAGMSVCVADFRATDDAVQRETRAGCDIYQVGFCLEGRMRWQNVPPGQVGGQGLGGRPECAVEAGWAWLERVGGGTCVSLFGRGGTCKSVSVTIAPARLEAALGDDAPLLFDRPRALAVTPDVGRVLASMQGCEGVSPIDRLYLEGKALEALALLFEQAGACPASVPAAANPQLSGDDCRALVEAKALIDRHYAQAVTIAGLARRVYLNECKLKRGFKLCFGVTVHDYLRSVRLDAARTLIERDGCKVADAARRVGYTSVGHFIEAFRAQFGVTPGSLQRRG